MRRTLKLFCFLTSVIFLSTVFLIGCKGKNPDRGTTTKDLQISTEIEPMDALDGGNDATAPEPPALKPASEEPIKDNYKWAKEIVNGKIQPGEMGLFLYIEFPTSPSALYKMTRWEENFTLRSVRGARVLFIALATGGLNPEDYRLATYPIKDRVVLFNRPIWQPDEYTKILQIESNWDSTYYCYIPSIEKLENGYYSLHKDYANQPLLEVR